MIELRGVGRVFRIGSAEVAALRGVDLAIDKGAYVSLMGPSGSGKSTLLHILGCLDRPTTGTYTLDGEDVTHLPEEALSRIRQHRIGFVFQTFHLVPRLTAEGNVELPMVFAGVPRAERLRRAREALVSVGLEARRQHRPEELSGGERQRVAIARAIVMGPQILLADEPTGNLDRKAGDEIVALLEGMNRDGITVVVVTHDAALGGRARRRITLADGDIVGDVGVVPGPVGSGGAGATGGGVNLGGAPRR